MTTERSVESRARTHAALGDPLRLRIVDRLVLGDAAPGELGAELGVRSNLLAHHLKLLGLAGVVRRVRSEGDGRRAYVRLALDALPDLGLRSGKPILAPRVVFVCSRNSARSQLAEAAWRRVSRVPSASAGTRPATVVHPKAVTTARRHGLSLARARTSHVDDVLHPSDLVVAVCDNAHEQLAAAAPRLHWSIPDPARTGSEAAFERAYDEITGRVARLAPWVDTTTGSGS